MHLRITVIILTGILLISCSSSREDNDTYHIAVIPKGTTHVFWKSIHAGAIRAEHELNDSGIPVKIIWKGPLKEDDRSAQINVVENFIGQKIDGIVLAPLDSKALVAPVIKAERAGIPTVIFDSGLEYDGIVSFAATDNYKGGRIAGECLVELLGGKGKVIMMRYMVGSASSTAREQGFLDVISQYSKIHLLSDDKYTGATRDTAYSASQNILNRYGEEVDGIFMPNESSTNGMLLALRSIGRAGGDVKFVGFDGGDQNVQGIESGDLQGIVIQDPFKMGYTAVKLMVQYLQSLSIEKRVNTGVTLVTPDNLNDEYIQMLLFPPLDQYLEM